MRADALVEQGYPAYLGHYAANICVGTACYPALEQAMDAARRARRPARHLHQQAASG